MKFTEITGNGNFPLTTNSKSTNSSEVTIYSPSNIGGATIALGYLDDTETAIPYPDGGLLVNDAKRVLCGSGVNLIAIVTGYTVNFKIGYAS